eukprot:jgi/Ulvmu1/1856/UM012_0012.1
MSVSDTDSAESDADQQPTWARRNTDGDTEVTQDVLGFQVRLQQYPGSQHLGLTVWDASIVCAKYMEKQSWKRSRFHPSRMRGSRAIELGSGPGLAGLAAAMLGSSVVLTDVASVVPLIEQNIRLNFESAAWAQQAALRQQFGAAAAAELDWTVPQQLDSFRGPYELVLCTDCVYHEHLVRDLARVVLHCAGSKTTVLVCNEFRSASVHAEFKRVFGGHFVLRAVGRKHMDAAYQHPDIHLLSLTRRKRPLPDAVPVDSVMHTGVPGPGVQPSATEPPLPGQMCRNRPC